jgi:hypothetical protein
MELLDFPFKPPDILRRYWLLRRDLSRHVGLCRGRCLLDWMALLWSDGCDDRCRDLSRRTATMSSAANSSI